MARRRGRREQRREDQRIRLDGGARRPRPPRTAPGPRPPRPPALTYRVGEGETGAALAELLRRSGAGDQGAPEVPAGGSGESPPGTREEPEGPGPAGGG